MRRGLFGCHVLFLAVESDKVLEGRAFFVLKARQVDRGWVYFARCFWGQLPVKDVLAGF